MRTILAACVLVVFAQTAMAQSFSVGGGTEYPVGFHIDGIVDFPEHQLYSRVRYARFLEMYTESMNDAAESMDFYDSATGEIIAESLKNASMIELGLGWTQAPDSGWYAEAAYSIIKGKGQVTGAQILAVLNGATLPGGGNNYDIEGEVQALSIRGGKKFIVGEKSVLWLSFGLMKPLASETDLYRETTTPLQEAILKTANRELDEYMADVMKSDVFIPLLSASWVCRF